MTRMAGFSEATYIALHSMALIARKKGERISIGEMAKTLGVSEAHLAKVILRLSRSGFIVTTRGPGGGAVLARKPEEINFLESACQDEIGFVRIGLRPVSINTDHQCTTFFYGSKCACAYWTSNWHDNVCAFVKKTKGDCFTFVNVSKVSNLESRVGCGIPTN